MNNIYDNGHFNLYDAYFGHIDNIISKENWWGTINISEIENKLSGNITFIPFLCESYPTNWISDENGICKPRCNDSDKDGVCNELDLCPKTKQGEAVDNYGCSHFQFCARQPLCGKGCDLADWKNNEPLRNPRDCITVIVNKEGESYPKCAALEGLKCGD